MTKPSLLILAAGIGSRYGGLKQVDGIGPGGEAILEYSVYDALKAGFGKIIFVIRKDIEDAFREKVGRRVEPHADVHYAFQEWDTALEWLPQIPHREKPWGTGHAVLAARPFIQEPFATINADDFYGAEAFAKLGDFLKNKCTPQRDGMVAYQLANTLSENGAVSRGVCAENDAHLLTDITERTQIERFPEGIAYVDDAGARHLLSDQAPVSMNLWGFHHDVMPEAEGMFREFVQKNLQAPRAEFYIPTVVSTLINSGKIELEVLHSASKWYGVTYSEDKATVQAALRGMADEGLYPGRLWD